MKFKLIKTYTHFKFVHLRSGTSKERLCCKLNLNALIKLYKVVSQNEANTLFVPLAAQVAYQSHFGWGLIKTLGIGAHTKH